MQSHTGLDPMDHLCTDRGVVNVCADVDSGEDGHDMKCEGVAHGIYPYVFNLCHEGLRVYIPIKRSGMSSETASHARYIDPRLCPRRVNIGHVASSTRYLEFRNTKCSDFGESSMSNLD